MGKTSRIFKKTSVWNYNTLDAKIAKRQGKRKLVNVTSNEDLMDSARPTHADQNRKIVDNDEGTSPRPKIILR